MRTDRIFSRLEQEPHRPCGPFPRMSRVRLGLFSVTVAFYLAIVVAVLGTTWLVQIDWQVMLFRPYKQWPAIHGFLDAFVVLGQRGPTAVLVAAWLGWRSWRQRTLRPLLALAFALLLLNVSVGAVKIGLGRLGPHYATEIGSAELLKGGDIFPSGHTANAVVTWGILAYLATTPLARRWLSVVGAVFALGVGATTVYLGTHWVSDVLLGWAAGLVILLGLPWCEPAILRVEAFIYALRERFTTAGSRLAPAPASSPTGQPVSARGKLVGPRVPAQDSGSGNRSAAMPRATDEAHAPASRY
ncbi:phosphatase PAP2 family protein [Streptomyces diacarni]|nr:phosphatase PAP2 family protein [Streptomyces diacarni]